jgi:hypothetical protein
LFQGGKNKVLVPVYRQIKIIHGTSIPAKIPKGKGRAHVTLGTADTKNQYPVKAAHLLFFDIKDNEKFYADFSLTTA